MSDDHGCENCDNLYEELADLEAKIKALESRLHSVEAERDELKHRLEMWDAGHELVPGPTEELIAENSRLGNELFERSSRLSSIGKLLDEWQQAYDRGVALAMPAGVNKIRELVVERNDQNCLPASGSANTGSVAGRVIAERSTSDPSAGVDGADRESPQQIGQPRRCQHGRDGYVQCNLFAERDEAERQRDAALLRLGTIRDLVTGWPNGSALEAVERIQELFVERRCPYCNAPDNGTCAYPSERKPGCVHTPLDDAIGTELRRIADHMKGSE